MFSRPEGLPDELVASTVVSAWGIDVASCEYLAVGFGSHHWAIDHGEGVRWFLTVDDLEARRHGMDEPLSAAHDRLDRALGSARRLRDAGLHFVVAPLTTSSGAVLAPIGARFRAALHPWVEGRSHPYGEYPSAADRLEVVSLMAALHGSAVETVPDARREDFAIPHRAELLRAMDDVGGRWGSGPFAERARRLLRARAGGVESLLRRYDHLVAEASTAPDRVVVTHGEPHPANTISTPAGRVLVDWDTLLVAPPERDLWMVLGEDDEASAAYETATGVRPQTALLDLYRMLWDLMEIAGYVSFFREPHTESADAAESWENLNRYLDVDRRWPPR